MVKQNVSLLGNINIKKFEFVRSMIIYYTRSEPKSGISFEANTQATSNQRSKLTCVNYRRIVILLEFEVLKPEPGLKNDIKENTILNCIMERLSTTVSVT